jgi:hypothetical protein
MGSLEALFIAQIVVLLLVGRLLGEAMQRVGQPAVMGQLLAGVLLGPSMFGVVWPEAAGAVPRRARTESDARVGFQFRYLDALAADGHGDRSQAGQQRKARRYQRVNGRNLAGVSRSV